MRPMDSEQRPGLGEAIFAVYGVTRGMHETGVPRGPHGAFRRTANALCKRVRRILAGEGTSK